MHLTAVALQALKPREKPYKVTDGGGLFAEVLPTGSIVWRYQFLLHGKRSKVTLGTYRKAGDPKTNVKMTLEAARLQHLQARELVRRGENPAAAKQLDKKTNRFSNEDVKLVSDLFALWLLDIADKSEATVSAAKGWWEKDIKPQLGHRYINSVTSSDVEAVVARVKLRGSPASAEKVAMTIRHCYAFGLTHRLARENPAVGIVVAKKVKTRSHRPLEMSEIGPFLRALAADTGREENKIAVRLLALTLVRKTMLRLARKTEFDLPNRVWRCPEHRMKMGEAHDVYLSTQALALLERAFELSGDSPFVFHGQSSRSRPIGHSTLNAVIDRIDIRGGRFVPHGLRATASSLLNDASHFRGEVIEKALAHEERNKVRKIYNRASYSTERAEMLQWWADYLDALEGGKDVIPMRFERMYTTTE